MEAECAGTLQAIMSVSSESFPDHVACDAGHSLPPKQWLVIAQRLSEGR